MNYETIRIFKVVDGESIPIGAGNYARTRKLQFQDVIIAADSLVRAEVLASEISDKRPDGTKNVLVPNGAAYEVEFAKNGVGFYYTMMASDFIKKFGDGPKFVDCTIDD